MITQRLALLCLLVVVAGSCSIWYTKMILPTKMAQNEISFEVEPNGTSLVVPAMQVEKPATNGTVSIPTNAPAASAQSATADTSVDADISAIAADADSGAAYDDSSVEAGITGGATSVTNAYGI